MCQGVPLLLLPLVALSIATSAVFYPPLSSRWEEKYYHTLQWVPVKPAEITHLATWVYLILPFTEWFAWASLSLSPNLIDAGCTARCSFHTAPLITSHMSYVERRGGGWGCRRCSCLSSPLSLGASSPLSPCSLVHGRCFLCLLIVMWECKSKHHTASGTGTAVRSNRIWPFCLTEDRRKRDRPNIFLCLPHVLLQRRHTHTGRTGSTCSNRVQVTQTHTSKPAHLKRQEWTGKRRRRRKKQFDRCNDAHAR